ncbi:MULTISPECIES: PD40 domain-containing protein [unclassified Pseudoalteromonas]|uniref:PD40 domain-containing protein n=1 Tax=unclassified Pseudoalteromonas TaxID=194690 RepID=UPI0013FD2809|nr:MULTISPECIES: PD40 domain-containing protein [unclassified Pseudoalteromonas]MBH0014389.1 PD40 domain-containing protein [Pseudoalteromonas sp. NZS100_1]
MTFLKNHSMLCALSVCFSLLLSGCSEPSSQSSPQAEVDVAKYPWAKEHKNHPEWPLEIREEVYGDADTFSTPRLMFWNKYKYSEVYTLWSSRLDGSDRRRIIPEEIFTQMEPAGLHPPARSPDNRYIAISGYINDRATRQLYDTKEKKLITMSGGGGYPWFNWTSDSKNVIFYSDGKNFNYHVPTGELTPRPQIHHSGAAFLLPGDKEFLAIKHDGFWIHKFNGEIVRKVNFGFPRKWEMKNHRISPDGKYLAFMTYGREDFHFHWVNIANPEIEHSEKGEGNGVIFSLDEDVTLKFGYNPRGEVDENNKAVTYSIITQTNILTGEQQVIRTKEMRMWGLRSIAPIAITNQKAQSN